MTFIPTDYQPAPMNCATLRGTNLACVTDTSIGKGMSISDHWRKGARYTRYARGGGGAYITCVGLQCELPGRRLTWQVQVALKRCC